MSKSVFYRVKFDYATDTGFVFKGRSKKELASFIIREFPFQCGMKIICNVWFPDWPEEERRLIAKAIDIWLENTQEFTNAFVVSDKIGGAIDKYLSHSTLTWRRTRTTPNPNSGNKIFMAYYFRAKSSPYFMSY